MPRPIGSPRTGKESHLPGSDTALSFEACTSNPGQNLKMGAFLAKGKLLFASRSPLLPNIHTAKCNFLEIQSVFKKKILLKSTILSGMGEGGGNAAAKN